MGIIKDGSISGNLPSSSQAFAVNYPGYPSSIEHAVETLGGSQGIIKHVGREIIYPNKFVHISQINWSYIFVLEIHIHTQPLGNFGPNLKSSYLDKCNWSFLLLLLLNFQRLIILMHVIAVHADVARRRKRKWAEVEPQFEKGGLMDVDQEDLMILVPPLFSIKDVPEKVALKPSVDLSSKKKQEGVVQHRWEMEIEPSLAIDFNIKDILIPKKGNWEKYIARDSDQWKWQTAVCELFDEHPIWVKDSLAERLLDRGLTFKSDMLRRLLFRAAYYFSNGPFLRFWIRKGYNPRRDPESRIYQRINFRVPPSLRSYADANVASRFSSTMDDYIQQEIRKLPSQTTCSVEPQLRELPPPLPWGFGGRCKLQDVFQCSRVESLLFNCAYKKPLPYQSKWSSAPKNV
ncbi:Transcription factor IIIC [Forsythia ovata]|uniref:Transcription factor IIIC n=1 Tax=Forsythia ovata TaxID=205694 RepID=A0ABD1TQ61_9LAMI